MDKIDVILAVTLEVCPVVSARFTGVVSVTPTLAGRLANLKVVRWAGIIANPSG